MSASKWTDNAGFKLMVLFYFVLESHLSAIISAICLWYCFILVLDPKISYRSGPIEDLCSLLRKQVD